VDVRLAHLATTNQVEDSYYCAGHATEVLTAIADDFARQRYQSDANVDDCAVDIELVVSDGREDWPSQVVLQEIGGARRLLLEIGRFESWLLAWELRREPAPTLSTHRAMATAFQSLGGNLTKVSLKDVSEGWVFHAQVHILQHGSFVVVDMRPSDALALAVICKVPVYVESLVWQKTLR
jgi:bifunctional DNase/RNase